MTTARGTVVSFNAGTWKAVVRVDGSAPMTLTGVSTNRGIASADMAAGRSVVVDFGDHGDPADTVVMAVFT